MVFNFLTRLRGGVRRSDRCGMLRQGTQAARFGAEALESRLLLADATASLHWVDASAAGPVVTTAPLAPRIEASSRRTNGTTTSGRRPPGSILTVTINQSNYQADPADSSPINFTVVFSAAVNDFSAADVTLAGSARPTLVRVSGIGTTYNVAVSGMTRSGTVIASIDWLVAHAPSLSNRPNELSTSTDNVVTYVAPTVRFSDRTISVNEDRKSATLTVIRTGNTDTAATVNYTTSGGTAKAKTDYKPTFGKLKFAAGQTSKTITVPILDDTIAEINETIELVLSDPTGDVMLGTASTAVLTIVDNDDQIAPTVKLGEFPKIVEGESNLTFQVIYTDNHLLDASSIGDEDVVVIGPNGYSELATLVDFWVNSKKKSITASYEAPAPDGAWDNSDNGTYALWSQNKQVYDTHGNAAPKTPLGGQKVAIPSTPSESEGYGVRLQAISSLGWGATGTVKVNGQVMATGPEGATYDTLGPDWTFYPSGTVLEISVSGGFLTGGSEIYILDPRTGRSQSLFHNSTLNNVAGAKVVKVIP